MKISNHALELLKVWEGCKLNIYPDSKGLPTIGIGHLLTKSELASGIIHIKGEEISSVGGLTELQALDLIDQDLAPVEAVVDTSLKVKVTQNQFDALVIFAFNIGNHGYLTSQALSTLNSGDFDGVPDKMRLWNKTTIKGKLVVSNGLKNRREHEISLYKGEV